MLPCRAQPQPRSRSAWGFINPTAHKATRLPCLAQSHTRLRPSQPLGANDTHPAKHPSAPLAAARGEGGGWDCPLRGRTSRLSLRVASQPLGFPLAFGAPSDCALIGRWRCRASPRASASPSAPHTLAQIHPLPPCWLPASHSVNPKLGSHFVSLVRQAAGF